MCNSGECILFIDNIEGLLGIDVIEDMGNVAQLFKLALSHGEFQCLGISTSEAYKSMIKHDTTIQMFFEKVQVDAMTVEETINVLKGVRLEYEKHYQVSITNEALKASAELAGQYISNCYLPGNAIVLLDVASSQVHTLQKLGPLYLGEAIRDLESVLREKSAIAQNQEYELPAELLNRELQIRERISKLEANWKKHGNVDEEAIIQIVSAETG